MNNRIYQKFSDKLNKKLFNHYNVTMKFKILQALKDAIREEYEEEALLQAQSAKLQIKSTGQKIKFKT